jgi:hypothetical protein
MDVWACPNHPLGPHYQSEGIVHSEHKGSWGP